MPSLSEYPMEDYIFENKTIMDMELLILYAFEWKLGTITPFDYLHYFLKKFCGESKPGSIVSTAVEHIVTIAKGYFCYDLLGNSHMNINIMFLMI